MAASTVGSWTVTSTGSCGRGRRGSRAYSRDPPASGAPAASTVVVARGGRSGTTGSSGSPGR
ncbi:hypothetical protein FTX61_11385 [Nitriliruptoraceae bacterium ZYF776]|nr:hypothetical protein [Profundirhabdus halotolerans]